MVSGLNAVAQAQAGLAVSGSIEAETETLNTNAQDGFAVVFDEQSLRLTFVDLG